MRARFSSVLFMATFLSAAPAAAGLLGSSPPTIVVRNQPSVPFSTIYVSYVGSLAEMIVAEEEVKMILAKSGVAVLGSSADAADADELQSDGFYARVIKRIGTAKPPAAIFIIRSARMIGSELSFSVRLHSVAENKETAVGDVTVDIDKQPTINGSPALASRIAIRDVCKRFLRDKRIAPFFGNGVN